MDGMAAPGIGGVSFATEARGGNAGGAARGGCGVGATGGAGFGGVTGVAAET